MNRRVSFNETDARRIAAATRAYERGNRDQQPIMFRQSGEDGDPVRLGKTSQQWEKNTITSIDLYEGGTPPNETITGSLGSCVNKFAYVNAGKWVIVARGANGYWYLIAAEC